MTDSFAAGRLPIVMGVAGHRNLDKADWPVYQARVQELFADLRRRYPATPLRIISSLAEGADCLVANEALTAGCEVLVPLPLAAAEYERDFPATVDEFRALQNRIPAGNVFVVPPARLTDAQDAPHDAQARDRQYAASGAFVALHCHFLIALWDGIPTDSVAGTGAVVRLKLYGSTAVTEPQFRVLDAPDTGPIYHVLARRSESAGGVGAPQRAVLGETRWLYPEDTDQKKFDLIFSRMDRFNSDPRRAQITGRTAAVAAELLPDAAALAPAERALATLFATADQLAGGYRRITQGVLRTVLFLAAVLAMTYEVYAEILPLRVVPTVYLTLFATITLVYLWQRRIDAQGRYLDYRAVAEGLRVQFYWRVAGLGDDVFANYLRKQLDELRWIREALRGVSAAPPAAPSQVAAALRHWVGGQTDYYRVRASLQEHRLHRIEWLSAACILSGLLAAASLVIFWQPLEHVEKLHHWVVLLMGFAPIAAALWEAYGEKAGLRAQANQYARFATVFKRAASHIEQLAAAPPSPARHAAELELLRELGREALMENGDWVLLLRERPIVVPKG